MPMQSRTDQVHSYQFFLQRVVSGLVAKESDPAELPYRRLGWAGFGSVMLTVLLAAGFGIYGVLIGGGADGWRDGRSVILERETGQVYIYRDDRLHPMANLVSAQLALTGQTAITRVSARSLAGVPRGGTLGIAGAPPALPGASELLSGGWSQCTIQQVDGQGDRRPVTVLAVGTGSAGGAPAGDEALLVRDIAAEPAGLHLVWQGHRHALDPADPAPALRALGVSPERALPVAAAWLDSLPVGDPLQPATVPVPGEPTQALGEAAGPLDLRAGQVIAVAGTPYLVTVDELRELTPLLAAALLADPATGPAYPEAVADLRTDVPAGLLAGAPVRSLPEPAATSLPDRRPAFAELAPADHQDGAVCAEFAPGEFVPQVVPGARLAGVEGAVATPEVTVEGALLADQVLVAGGRAALVEAIASPSAVDGSWHIVTDQGIRYAMPDPEAVGWLGYQPAQRVRVPAGLLARLPAGPALDPVVAAQPVAAVGD